MTVRAQGQVRSAQSVWHMLESGASARRLQVCKSCQRLRNSRISPFKKLSLTVLVILNDVMASVDLKGERSLKNKEAIQSVDMSVWSLDAFRLGMESKNGLEENGQGKSYILVWSIETPNYLRIQEWDSK